MLLPLLVTLSCKKDYSREGVTAPGNLWEFRESQQTFGGPVDSAVIVNSVNGETLVIYGTSGDGLNGKFYLTMASEKLAAGDADASGGQFRYEVGSDFLSSGEPSEVSITIIEIDGETISGTFSGSVTDSHGQTQLIEDGRFKSSLTRRASLKRTLTVWTKELCDATGQLEIRVNNSSQYITTALTAQPSCSGPGTVSFSLDAGNYEVAVICGLDTLTYDATVNDECTLLEAGLNNDYLPLGTNSYWHYANMLDADVTQIFTADEEVSLNGTTYTRLTGTRGDIYYFRKSSHSYFQYRELGFQDFISNPPSVELVILKDNLSAGQTWETDPLDVDISGVIRKIKMVSTIVNRDYSETIHGVRYDNLIKVNTELYFSPDNGVGYASSGSAYNTVFAKGKGIVSYNDMDVAIEWGLTDVFLSP